MNDIRLYICDHALSGECEYAFTNFMKCCKPHRRGEICLTPNCEYSGVKCILYPYDENELIKQIEAYYGTTHNATENDITS